MTTMVLMPRQENATSARHAGPVRRYLFKFNPLVILKKILLLQMNTHKLIIYIKHALKENKIKNILKHYIIYLFLAQLLYKVGLAPTKF